MAVSLIYTKKGTPFIDQYNETAKKMAVERNTYRQGQKDLRATFREQAGKDREADIKKSNEQYDASGRQNYINYMQARKRLPSELSALGIRGGASESSLIRLGNTYGSNVASNEAARGTANAGIKQTYATKLADYDRDYQTSLSDYDKDYNARLTSAYTTAYQNQIQWEKEQQQKDLEYFSGVIEGLYGDTDKYDTLIAQLQKSDDPNKEYKIMLAQKAKQTLIDKQRESYSGGGGGGGYSYGGGGGGGYYYEDSGGGSSSSSKAKATSSGYYNPARRAARNRSGSSRSSSRIYRPMGHGMMQ